MVDTERFNYIITIHNKADLIEKVMWHVLMCCRDNSHIYPVLDGCTDSTEEIIDQIIDANLGVPITKVKTPDVHEIRAINAGLAAANLEGDGYNIVLQDDVLLADYNLETKVRALYSWGDQRLGFVSFRLGANLTQDAVTSQVADPFADFVENAFGHGLAATEIILPGQFSFRSICIKSPICLPFWLVRSLGPLADELAPYMYDDVEYSLRSKRAGYVNGVFGLKFASDVRWGSTRTADKAREMAALSQRNMNIIRGIYQDDISQITRSVQSTDIINVPYLVDENENVKAMLAWQESRRLLDAYHQSHSSPRLVPRIMSAIKRTMLGNTSARS